MTSGGSKQADSGRPFARDWLDRLRRPLFRATAPTPPATLETWENEDFLQTREDEETIFDPWHDDMPERRSISPQTDKVTAGTEDNTEPEPLSLDSVFADEPEASEDDDEFEALVPGEEGRETLADNGTEDYDFDPEDFDGAFSYYDDPDAEAWPDDSDPALNVGIELFGYDEEARQSVWNDEPEDDVGPSLQAEQKAAEIISKLSFSSQRERTAFLPWMIDLFQRRDHHFTYRAILAVAETGVGSETLRNMAILRDVWENRPEWWLGRYGWAHSIEALRNGPTALGWKLARSICEARSDFPPEYMIDDAWVNEWLSLGPYDHGYWNFPQFLGLKTMAVDETFQDVPSWSDLRQHEHGEFGDRHNEVERAFGDAENRVIGYGRPLLLGRAPNNDAAASERKSQEDGDGG